MSGRPSPPATILDPGASAVVPVSAGTVTVVDVAGNTVAGVGGVLDLRYPGGKGQSGLQQWICNQQPPHVYYVEPFAGKAGVFRLKVPALRTLLIDRNRQTVAWLRSYLAGGGEGGRHHHGRRSCRVLRACGIRYLEWLAGRDYDPQTLVYCDPPYHPSTRVKLKLYRYEMGHADHCRFLDAVLSLRCPVQVSGYMCDLYAERLADWRLTQTQVITRGRTMATECLWSNGPASEATAIGLRYHQLGGDYRERERVSRLIKRRVEEYRGRGSVERYALLMELIEAEADLRAEGLCVLQSQNP